MHQTLLPFKHNIKAVINGITSNYSNGCLEGFNRKIKQIERKAFDYANFHNLLARNILAKLLLLITLLYVNNYSKYSLKYYVY